MSTKTQIQKPTRTRADHADQEIRLTTAEVAQLYRVSVTNVLAWIHSGALPATDTSRGSQRKRYRIRPSDLIVFDARRATGPKPKAARRRRRQPEKIGSDGRVIEYW